MDYTLMQKDEKVIDVAVDEYYGDIVSLGQVYTPERLPLSVRYHSPRGSLKGSLQSWMNYRNMPKSRALAGDYFTGGASSVAALSLRSLGLNLNDQYWFKPKDSNVKWKDVNFFQNDFSGKLLEMGYKSELPSPDFSSNGNLPKFWFIDRETGNRVLAKAGTGPAKQEVANEVIASWLLQKAGLPHVTYIRRQERGQEYSICETFITPDTEYIPAYEIRDVLPQRHDRGEYGHFLDCVVALGIPNVKEPLDRMLQFDYLINNTDRHMGNFGFIRDVNTLKFLGMVPIFDNGNSLWFDKSFNEISVYKQEASPFARNQDKQVKLTDLSLCHEWLDRLPENFVEQTMTEELERNRELSSQRIQAILFVVRQRRQNLEILAEARRVKSALQQS